MKQAKASEIKNDYQLFHCLVDMKRQYKKYSKFHETLQKDIDDVGSFSLKDERLPGLIKELSEISCLEYVSDPQLDIAGDNNNEQNAVGLNQRDQSCQVDQTMFNDTEARNKEQACFIDDTEMDNIKGLIDNDLEDAEDDTECGSTEDVQEKSFSKIKSCSLMKEANLSEWCDISDSCFLPDGEIVLVESHYGHFKVLDSDLKVTVELRLWKSEQKAKHVAVVDRNTVVAFVSPSKLLQFITIKPELKIGEEIRIKCECDGLACFKKELYVYTRCLDERSCLRYEGFQILSLKGEILKIIPLFDDILCFSLTKKGNIMYFGCRLINEKKESFLKCITKDGSIVCQSPFPKADLPGDMEPDDEGNIIINDRSAFRTGYEGQTHASIVEVFNAGGKRKRIISPESKWQRITTLCYNKHNDTLLVVGRDPHKSSSMNVAKLYKLDYEH